VVVDVAFDGAMDVSATVVDDVDARTSNQR